MFDLEKQISTWRAQMLAAGIQSLVRLDELEGHLRDEIRAQMRAGKSEEAAFVISVLEMGEAGSLKTEFAKVGETLLERVKRLFFACAGIPNYQLAMNMNTPNQNLEPRWATYFKSAALIIPAIVFWVGSCVFVVPKFKDICATTGIIFPKPVLLALFVSGVVKNYFFLGSLVVLTALVLLEWRSHSWPRYRRLVFGVTAFSLNLTALILITILMVFAVIAASSLLPTK